MVGRPARSRAEGTGDRARGRPDRYVTCSHLASARSGEYERFAAAAINAFLGPETDGYLTRLKRDLVGTGLDGPLLIMQAAGGVASDELAASLPVLTIGSGPSAGVAAARYSPRAAASRM